jgi:hypothetical protein
MRVQAEISQIAFSRIENFTAFVVQVFEFGLLCLGAYSFVTCTLFCAQESPNSLLRHFKAVHVLKRLTLESYDVFKTFF